MDFNHSNGDKCINIGGKGKTNYSSSWGKSSLCNMLPTGAARIQTCFLSCKGLTQTMELQIIYCMSVTHLAVKLNDWSVSQRDVSSKLLQLYHIRTYGIYSQWTVCWVGDYYYHLTAEPLGVDQTPTHPSLSAPGGNALSAILWDHTTVMSVTVCQLDRPDISG